jgi:hypothetical protein
VSPPALADDPSDHLDTLRSEQGPNRRAVVGGVIEKLEAQAEEAERQAAHRRKIVDMARELGEEGLAELVALMGSAEPNGNGGGNGSHGGPEIVEGPRGRDAIRVIVRERPGVWTSEELRLEMQRRGWFTSSTGLTAAAKRLCDVNGEGKRIGPGRYLFPANHEEEVEREIDPSGGAKIPFSLE